MSVRVALEPWGPGDLWLLERLLGDPEMTRFLGGPETPEALERRQRRYETLPVGDHMFKIVDLDTGAGIGSVGYWVSEWHGARISEAGWSVLPECQGRGVAVAATAQAIEIARDEDRQRCMHAFPNVENLASNAICRRLGFELVGPFDGEYPKGHPMTCNDWRLDLRDR